MEGAVTPYVALTPVIGHRRRIELKSVSMLLLISRRVVVARLRDRSREVAGDPGTGLGSPKPIDQRPYDPEDLGLKVLDQGVGAGLIRLSVEGGGNLSIGRLRVSPKCGAQPSIAEEPDLPAELFALGVRHRARLHECVEQVEQPENPAVTAGCSIGLSLEFAPT